MSKNPFMNCKSRKRRKNKNVPTLQPKEKLLCPRTMVRYDGSHADYPTKWVCKMFLKELLSEAAVKNHLNTCSALNREPEPAPTNNEETAKITPYICKYCDRVFSITVTLKRHLEKHKKPPELSENEIEYKLKNLKTERKILKEYFSLWGIPEKLVTDNGSSLCSTEMSEFLSKNGVFHIRTPPYNPSSNGAAENTVKTFKQFLKKCAKNTDMDTNICNFVLTYNSTKHCATGVSPAELHLGRPLNTSLDRLVPFAKHKYN
ncbi:unnamed protein product [Macrosiphum euphorbiae]|nr:unnamed protein product [Macrosiphum euphorbiae]CAI6346514.1 unnamed protein product [Macrosiphum euphorbiae]CAI6348420.1 unnamed protein product [Macrosiphum euphorbiae]